MPYQRPPNRNLPLPPMDPYAMPYLPPGYGPPPIPYGHQQFFYPQESLVQTDDAQYDLSVHAHWRDRVVPLPGFRSSRTLRPTPESSRIIIRDPKKSPQTNKKQLLPPRSHGVLQTQTSKVKEGGETPEIPPSTRNTPVSSRNYLLERFTSNICSQEITDSTNM